MLPPATPMPKTEGSPSLPSPPAPSTSSTASTSPECTAVVKKKELDFLEEKWKLELQILKEELATKAIKKNCALLEQQILEIKLKELKK